MGGRASLPVEHDSIDDGKPTRPYDGNVSPRDAQGEAQTTSQTDKTMLVCGGANVGKTWLIKQLMDKLKLSTTGIKDGVDSRAAITRGLKIYKSGVIVPKVDSRVAFYDTEGLFRPQLDAGQSQEIRELGLSADVTDLLTAAVLGTKGLLVLVLDNTDERDLEVLWTLAQLAGAGRRICVVHNNLASTNLKDAHSLLVGYSSSRLRIERAKTADSFDGIVSHTGGKQIQHLFLLNAHSANEMHNDKVYKRLINLMKYTDSVDIGREKVEVEELRHRCSFPFIEYAIVSSAGTVTVTYRILENTEYSIPDEVEGTTKELVPAGTDPALFPNYPYRVIQLSGGSDLAASRLSGSGERDEHSVPFELKGLDNGINMPQETILSIWTREVLHSEPVGFSKTLRPVMRDNGTKACFYFSMVSRRMAPSPKAKLPPVPFAGGGSCPITPPAASGAEPSELDHSATTPN